MQYCPTCSLAYCSAIVVVVVIVNLARLCDHTPNALNTKSVLRKEIRLKMAHESWTNQNTQEHAASRGLSAIAELLVTF